MKINQFEIVLLLAEKEMTRSELAQECGVTKQCISGLLSRGTCAEKTAGKLAKVLGVSVKEIAREEL